MTQKAEQIIDKLSQTQLVTTSLVAGAVAGALAKTVIAPLDRTKINFQIVNRPYNARMALMFIIHTYKKEGIFSLWRGNSATMARIIPYAAIQFCSHEQWKRVLHVDTGTGSGKGANQRRFLAGSLAGVTSQSLTYPLDLARARMAVTDKGKYNSLTQVFVRIWTEEGPKAFYRGYLPTVLGVIPYAGVSFYTYGTLKNYIAEHYGGSIPFTNFLYQLLVRILGPSNIVLDILRKKAHTPPNSDKYGGSNPFTNLICGAIAGMLGQSSSYPLDIVRRRMQTSAVTGQDYRTIVGTIIKVYSEEGLKNGVFKGLSMNWVKGPIAVGISFATYDHIRDYLRAFL